MKQLYLRTEIFKPIKIRWDPLSAQFHQFKSQPIIKLQKWAAPCSNRPFKAEWVSLDGVSAVFSAAESTEHHHSVCSSRACSSSSIFLWETALLEMEFLSCICQISSYQTLRPLNFHCWEFSEGSAKAAGALLIPGRLGMNQPQLSDAVKIQGSLGTEAGISMTQWV